MKTVTHTQLMFLVLAMSKYVASVVLIQMLVVLFVYLDVEHSGPVTRG